MIINLQSGAPTIKIDLSTCVLSEYATKSASSSSWGVWSNKNIQDLSTSNSLINDGDTNSFYVGTLNRVSGEQTHWATRLTIHMPLANVLPSRLIVQLTAQSNGRLPNRVRAYITDTVPASNETGAPANLSSKTMRARSFLYADLEGQTQQTSQMTTGQSAYFIFNYNFIAGQTYYIYIYPYSSNDAAITECDFQASGATEYTTMLRWTNYNSELQCYLTS